MLACFTVLAGISNIATFCNAAKVMGLHIRSQQDNTVSVHGSPEVVHTFLAQVTAAMLLQMKIPSVDELDDFLQE